VFTCRAASPGRADYDLLAEYRGTGRSGHMKTGPQSGYDTRYAADRVGRPGLAQRGE
jgi:hypothetical protein